MVETVEIATMLQLLGQQIVLLLVAICFISEAIQCGPPSSSPAPSLLPSNGEQDSEGAMMKYYSFAEFMRKFHKSYLSPSEQSRRESIFLYNQARAFISLAKYKLGQSAMYFTINQMSDLTRGELQHKLHHHKSGQDFDLSSGLLTRLLASLHLVKSSSNDSGIDLNADQQPQLWAQIKAEWKRRGYPDSRPGLRDKVFTDRRLDGCLNAAKCQGDCGSCAIFSTFGLYEWAYCKRHGAKVSFSEQYVIDCMASELGAHVCEDGIFESDLHGFVDEFGFELAKRYKYKGREMQCPNHDNNGKSLKRKQMGFIKLDRPELVEFPVYEFENQLKVSPIIVSFYLDDDTFANYGGGVDMSEKCNTTDSPHSMLIVGSGRERGVEYWLVRNSHGTDWGDEGHYKIKKINDCYNNEGFGITMDALYHGNDDIEGGTKLKYEFTKNPHYNWKILAKMFGHTKAPVMPTR